jgi:DNA-binding transcriptional ArsR family regulator
LAVDLYDALAEPVRRQIVELLARRRLPARRVAEAFGHISRPAVSRHLRLLREVGLVHAQLVGRERIYRADIGPLGEVETWIAGLRPGWEQRLDALETEVHRTRRERGRRVGGEAQATDPAATTQAQSA